MCSILDMCNGDNIMLHMTSLTPKLYFIVSSMPDFEIVRQTQTHAHSSSKKTSASLYTGYFYMPQASMLRPEQFHIQNLKCSLANTEIQEGLQVKQQLTFTLVSTCSASLC